MYRHAMHDATTKCKQQWVYFSLFVLFVWKEKGQNEVSSSSVSTMFPFFLTCLTWKNKIMVARNGSNRETGTSILPTNKKKEKKKKKRRQTTQLDPQKAVQKTNESGPSVIHDPIDHPDPAPQISSSSSSSINPHPQLLITTICFQNLGKPT